MTQNIILLKVVFHLSVRLNLFLILLLMLGILKWFMVVLGVLYNQVLFPVLVRGHDAGFALVEAGSGTRPVHLVARYFVLGEREFPDFQFP